ncbi:MAG: TIGR03086 family metal-binding protein [Actinomycetota bacterium]
MPPLVAGESIAQVGDRFDGDLLGADPAAAWRASAYAACDAFEGPGALERIVNLSFGDVPAWRYGQERLVDVFCHGWDLARAIGADERIPEDVVAASEIALEPFEDAWRAGGALGPVLETGPDADAQTRLLARLGRRA